MLRIAFVEDDKVFSDLMKTCLERYSRENDVNYSVDVFDSSLKFLSVFNCNYDIIFTDIKLPDLSGIELAREIRKKDGDVLLVFVTSYSVFAVNGYEFDVAEFIEKPVTYYNFALKFKHVLQKLAVKKDEVKLKVVVGTSVKFIPIANIYYIEVMNKKLTYHCFDREFETRGSLKSIEEELLKNDFAKCNNYCLVNLKYVYGVSGYILTLNTGVGLSERVKITISKPKRKAFVATLYQYLERSI